MAGNLANMVLKKSIAQMCHGNMHILLSNTNFNYTYLHVCMISNMKKHGCINTYFTKYKYMFLYTSHSPMSLNE